MMTNNDKYLTERIAALGYDYLGQEKKFIKSCNLCGADQWTVLAHRDRYGFPAQATSCDICGLTMLNPQMTARAYKYFYEQIYRPLVSAYYGRKIDALSIKPEQKVYANELERLLNYYLSEKRGGTFLDVGGSTGVVSTYFARRFDLQATVLDPAPDEIKEAHNLGIQTITALVEEWDPGDTVYDVVGMFQTIDHLLDINSTLAKLRTVIAEDGIFFVDIVDFRAAYLKNWNVESALKIDHPYSLTEDTIKIFLAKAGFTPIRKAYSSDYHLIGYVCKPSKPNSQSMPPKETVRNFFLETRFVQNSPRPTGGVLK